MVTIETTYCTVPRLEADRLVSYTNCEHNVCCSPVAPAGTTMARKWPDTASGPVSAASTDNCNLVGPPSKSAKPCSKSRPPS